MSLRDRFVALFGEANALAIETAAQSHANATNSENKGSDEFRWALLITIGHECISKYAEYHGITAPWEKVKPWLLAEADELNAHEGDVDYLCLLVGGYNFLSEGDENAINN